MLDRINGRPARRLSRWLPGGILLVDALLVAACVALSLGMNNDVAYLPNLVGFGLFPAAGAVILWKQPRNPVGWLAAGLGFVFVGNEFFFLYSTLALIVQPGAWPLGGFASWVSAWFWQIGYGVSIALILLFPNGRPPSRRWAWLIRASLVLVAPMVVLNMVLLWPYRGMLLMRAENDMSVLPVGAFLTQETMIWQTIIIFCILLAAAGLFLRFFHARGVERQQLKWIMLASVLVPASLLLGVFSSVSHLAWAQAAYQVMNIVSTISFPVAFAFAVTRYRLYEIDVIIRRTLLYSALTLILGALYLGLVLLIQGVLELITGQGSAAAIVLSTLVIAALFAPLRRRMQEVIDRRFYRQKYNADLMLERFAASQREMLELEQYHAQLLGIVAETLQPEFVELMMVRAGPREKGQG